MWDDFYEPSEFEIMIEDFKEELRSSVKKEYIDRIEHLEAELARLKDIRDNYDEKVRELNVAKQNAEIAAQMRRVRQERRVFINSLNR